RARERERLPAWHVLAAEAQQAAADVAAAPCRQRDAIQRIQQQPFAFAWAVGFAVALIAEALDDREHVVEVVRDAAGQPTADLQPLRVQELVLQLLPARHLGPQRLAVAALAAKALA